MRLETIDHLELARIPDRGACRKHVGPKDQTDDCRVTGDVPEGEPWHETAFNRG